MLLLLMAAAAAVPALDCQRAAPAFMARYAAELSAGDRTALARRYSRTGAYALGMEPKSFEGSAAIARRYAEAQCQKPDAFAWNGLSFEQVGPATCLVAGGFRWTSGARAMDFAYTAVLRGEADGLRILLEHENPLPKK